jgi:hypothetical protein
MNLREKLKYVLPNILPANPSEAMKGTELIRLVKMQLPQEYSDATLRYHFSIMCCDPSSPIAKVDQGQGYYHRSANLAGTVAAGPPYQAKLALAFEQQTENLDQAMDRQHKLRAIFFRQAQLFGNAPFLFETSFGPTAPYDNIWKCPDAALVDWQMGPDSDGSQIYSPELLQFKRGLGMPLFSVNSLKLKLEVNPLTLREDFYQTLSSSGWASQGELLICAPILDEQLAEDLRKLGTQHGIGISTLGLPMEKLDEMPPHWAIRQMSDREFEALQERLVQRRITSPALPRQFSWQTIEYIRRDNQDFETLWAWLERCLLDGKALPYMEYSRLTGSEKVAER